MTYWMEGGILFIRVLFILFRSFLFITLEITIEDYGQSYFNSANDKWSFNL